MFDAVPYSVVSMFEYWEIWVSAQSAFVLHATAHWEA